MSVATKWMTLQDYLNYDDGTDTRYEFVDGELIPIEPESNLNNLIASFLFATFLQSGIPYFRLSIGAQIAVSGARATARPAWLDGFVRRSGGSVGRGDQMCHYSRHAPAVAGS